MSLNKQENSFPKDIPLEVMEVWVVEYYGIPIGETLYNKLLENKKKYPEWFPKEKIK